MNKNITPKFHALIVHVPEFLKRNRNPSYALGYDSEQSSESVHYDFDSLWTGSRYKRPMNHEK